MSCIGCYPQRVYCYANCWTTDPTELLPVVDRLKLRSTRLLKLALRDFVIEMPATISTPYRLQSRPSCILVRADRGARNVRREGWVTFLRASVDYSGFDEPASFRWREDIGRDPPSSSSRICSSQSGFRESESGGPWGFRRDRVGESRKRSRIMRCFAHSGFRGAMVKSLLPLLAV